jgi:hypothetical protein
MLQKPSFYVVLSYFLFLLLALPGLVSAKDDKFALRLWGQVSPFLSGDAGSGSGAPHYDNVFNAGLGAGAEFSWQFSDRLSGLAGIGYETCSGDSHEGISFKDLKVVPVYLGGKFHITPKATRWDTYLRMDIGAAHLSSVDAYYQDLKERYWDPSWVFLFDAGAGVEYRLERWGLSLEGKFRYMGKPDSAMGYPSDAGSSWSIPVVLGINYHF